MVLSTARTGSNQLIELMHNFTNVDVNWEIFGKYQYNIQPRYLKMCKEKFGENYEENIRKNNLQVKLLKSMIKECKNPYFIFKIFIGDYCDNNNHLSKTQMETLINDKIIEYVIILDRKNKFDQYISMEKALKYNKWNKEDTTKLSINFNINRYLFYKKRHKEIYDYYNNISIHNKTLKLVYEHDICNTEALLFKINKFIPSLNRNIYYFIKGLDKQDNETDYSKKIENYDEVKDFINKELNTKTIFNSGNIFMYIYYKYTKSDKKLSFNEYLEVINIQHIEHEFNNNCNYFEINYNYYKLFPVHIINKFSLKFIKTYIPPFRLLIHFELSRISMIHRFGWSDVVKYILDHNYNELYEESSIYYKFPYFEWYQCALDKNFNTYDECIKNIDESYTKYNNMKAFIMAHFLEWEINYKNLKNCTIPRINFAHDPYISKEDTKKYKINNYKIWHENKNWIKIKDSNLNKIVFTTSNNQKKNFIKHNIVKKNIVETLYHPINLDNDNEFIFEDYMKNKHIYFIGCWLRDYKSFIKLAHSHKIILIKSKEGEWVNDYFLNQLSEIMNEYRKIDPSIPLLDGNNEEKITTFARNNNTDLKYNLTNTEYDKIFKESIIFLDLFDSSANNVVLECIRNNTPLLVRKHPACVEYLGNNYPFYFNTINEANSKCNDNKLILKTYLYLKNMDKSIFSYETYNNLFYNKIMSIL